MLRLLRICADGRAVQACVILVAERQGGVGGEIGQFGNRARYFRQIGQAAKVARHDMRHHVAAQKPQLPCQFRFVFVRQDALPVGKGGEVFGRERTRQPVVQPCQIQALMVELPRQPLRMRACFFQQGVCHYIAGNLCRASIGLRYNTDFTHPAAHAAEECFPQEY